MKLDSPTGFGAVEFAHAGQFFFTEYSVDLVEDARWRDGAQSCKGTVLVMGM